MTVATFRSTITVALVGNPNTGKSTLFCALAGARQRVGNYPGVTVERKHGRMLVDEQRFLLVDLPGTYSLAPRSLDEMVAVDVLLGRRAGDPPVDAVLAIVDASNLERNLYLVSQVLELGLPIVIALNMTDVAAARGVQIDIPRLSRQLGVAVVPVQANRRRGIAELKQALLKAAGTRPPQMESPLPDPFRRELSALEQALAVHGNGHAIPRYLAERLLLDSAGYLQGQLIGDDPQLVELLASARKRLAEAGCPVPSVEAIARYAWVGRVLDGVVTRPVQRVKTFGDRIDRFLTHKLWGTLALLLTMLLIFSAVFVAAAPLMGGIDDGIGAISELVQKVVPEGAVRSLLADGVVGGVGSVLIFLPQILILFFFVGVLEDCGYMARAAYLMDKLMVRVGLSGKSFIPLLSSFACAVPGIMATRVIENRRDRITTMLVAPLMSCSARLPVYTILIAAFIPQRSFVGGLIQLQGLTLLAMYALGVIVAAAVALTLKSTLLRGPTPPFVMELPSYKWPSPSTVLHRMLERAWDFVYRAGTLILAVAIVVWAASYYPHDEARVEAPFRVEKARLEAQVASPQTPQQVKQAAEAGLSILEADIAAAYQRQSYLGRVGQWIEPVVRPLGWDWRIGCAVVASFPAREVVMGVLGVIYHLGEDVDLGEQSGQSRLESGLKSATWDGTNQPVFNVPVALSIMVFFALCAQCASTLAVIGRETNSWRWPIFTFVYMTVLAYLGALVTYQGGMLIARHWGGV